MALDALLSEQIEKRQVTAWAKDAGISPRELFRIRRGYVRPSPLSIALIARALGIHPKEVAASCDVPWKSVAGTIKILGIS